MSDVVEERRKCVGVVVGDAGLRWSDVSWRCASWKIWKGGISEGTIRDLGIKST